MDAERHRRHDIGERRALDMDRELAPARQHADRQAQGAAEPFRSDDRSLRGLPIVKQVCRRQRDGLDRRCTLWMHRAKRQRFGSAALGISFSDRIR
ncbi:MAG TPA: hypothetical protein VKQ27_05830 [Acetobacteraceae bacterium]|nr:hypothetical protein [Acetobacteraceae bacterium]